MKLQAFRPSNPKSLQSQTSLRSKNRLPLNGLEGCSRPTHLPTTDRREILLTRYTHPEPELQLLIDRLKLRLPPQPPPRITTAAVTQASAVVKTF
jgi:hypothetical protein